MADKRLRRANRPALGELAGVLLNGGRFGELFKSFLNKVSSPDGRRAMLRVLNVFLVAFYRQSNSYLLNGEL